MLHPPQAGPLGAPDGLDYRLPTSEATSIVVELRTLPTGAP